VRVALAGLGLAFVLVGAPGLSAQAVSEKQVAVAAQPGPAHSPDKRDVALAREQAEARRTTIARALFEEGLRFVDAGRWQDAQDRFRRVLELRYSAVAAYNLGLAQARLGFPVVSAATLRKLLADPALEAKVRDPAAALLVEVEAQFAWLTLHVRGRCDECRVEVDREDWPHAALGVAVPIDPGAHALELRWENTVLASDRIELGAAARGEATLAVAPGALEAARGSRAADPSGSVPGPSRPRSNASFLESPLFWTAMGVLVAGGTTALILETR
jgi:tetratricopeptide (TPR) repeat protein